MESGMLVRALRSRLAGRVIGSSILYFDRLSSTMDRAREAAREGAPEGTVVIAGEQTDGRGRQGRHWVSPEGTLALSVIFRPGLSLLPGIMMISALAVVKAVFRTAGLTPGIKWPNDVLINGRKVCGILIENELRSQGVSFAVAGIGLNVGKAAVDDPAIAVIATSLESELGHSPEMAEVGAALLEELDILYADLKAGRPVFDEWRDRLVTIGRRVRIEHGPVVVEGMAEGVAPDGALMVRQDNGALAAVVAGDVTPPV